MPRTTEVRPEILSARTCSLIINIEPIKLLQYTEIFNASCTIHAHTIPSESIAIVLTVKDEPTRDEAVMKIAEIADILIEKMGWEITNIKVTSPEKLGATGG